MFRSCVARTVPTTAARRIAAGGALAALGSLPTAAPAHVATPRRLYNAMYGTRIRTHEDVIQAFAPAPTPEDPDAAALVERLRCKDGAAFVERALPLLERVEERLLEWKLAKWEFRIPPTLAGAEREAARRQLALVRAQMLEKLAARKADTEDLRRVGDLAGADGLSLEQLRLKPRSWVEEKITQMRWEGDVAAARELREAWLRLEGRGGPSRDLLERLALVYSLGRLGTFDDAFTNTIVPVAAEASTKIATSGSAAGGFKSLARANGAAPVAQMEQRNILHELLQLTLVNIPTISILHDFVGLAATPVLAADAVPGYRDALGVYLAASVRQQLQAAAPNAEVKPDEAAPTASTIVNRLGHRVPRAFADVANAVPKSSAQSLLRAVGKNAKGERVVLFDYRTAGGVESLERMERPIPPCDFAFMRGSDVTLITIASHNRYIRENQVVSGRQAQGIARRCAMLFGNDISAGRCRTLLLPPGFMDRTSLRRLHRVLGIDGDVAVATDGDAASTIMGDVEADLPTVPAECSGWVRFYSKDLTKSDEDYAVQSRKVNEEEWVRL